MIIYPEISLKRKRRNGFSRNAKATGLSGSSYRERKRVRLSLVKNTAASRALKKSTIFTRSLRTVASIPSQIYRGSSSGRFGEAVRRRGTSPIDRRRDAIGVNAEIAFTLHRAEISPGRIIFKKRTVPRCPLVAALSPLRVCIELKSAPGSAKKCNDERQRRLSSFSPRRGPF